MEQIMPVSELCRICLQEDERRLGMQPLFDEKDARCAEIVHKIEKCVGIELKNHEEFPKMICLQCLASLNTSYKFRSMCQASEQLLNAIVKSEPDELATSTQTKEKDIVDDDEGDETLLVLRPDFMEDQLVGFDDINETNPEFIDDGDDDDNKFLSVEEIDLDEIDGEEHLDDTDSDECIKIFDGEFVSILKKLKTVPKLKKDKALITKKNCVKKSISCGQDRKKGEVESETNLCEICGNIYTNRSLLNMHMSRHRAEKPFECEVYGKHFNSPSEFERHTRMHTGEKPFVCRFCNRTFSDRSSKKKHERIHTNERLYVCQTCGKKFAYSRVLKNHMLTHTGEKAFKCIPCKKAFYHKHNMKKHLNSIKHQRTVKKSISRGQDRKKNEVESETNISEICGNTYTNQSLLNMHMRRHRAGKPLGCECRFCGRTFCNSSTRKIHERIHTNERRYVCQTCGKSFTYLIVLKNHMLTHTGEKPFPCIPCKKTFSRKYRLDQHLRTIRHQQTVKHLHSQQTVVSDGSGQDFSKQISSDNHSHTIRQLN